MKFLKAIFVSLSLLFTASTAIAGSGHYHGPIDQAGAEQRAERAVSSLIKQSVLEPSWQGLPVTSVEKAEYPGDKVWLARFSNAKATDSAKQELYVYLTLTGGFITANYGE